MSWDNVKIDDFCDTQTGGTPKRSEGSRFYDGTIPWVKSGELRESTIYETNEHITEAAVEESSAKWVPKGALLVALYGATVGRIAELGIDATTNQAVCSIIPRNGRADQRFLFYALQTKVPEWLAKRVGGGQPNISNGIIRETKIPLPPLSEQKRIAGILDKADSIVRKRQQAIGLTEQFLRSTFLDMFGDPVTNPKGWPVGTIRELVTEAKYGTSKKADVSKGKFPMLRMNNLTYEGTWNLNAMKYVDLEADEESKYLVKNGDLLFNRTNSKELVGKTGVYDGPEPMAFAGYLIRSRTNEKANPEYVSGHLNSPFGKADLRHMCKSIVGMANINAQEFQDMRIMIPDIATQNRYAKIAEKVRTRTKKYESESQCVDNLFNSLVQRVFRGEL